MVWEILLHRDKEGKTNSQSQFYTLRSLSRLQWQGVRKHGGAEGLSYLFAIQSVVHTPISMESPGYLLELQSLISHLRPGESE